MFFLSNDCSYKAFTILGIIPNFKELLLLGLNILEQQYLLHCTGKNKYLIT